MIKSNKYNIIIWEHLMPFYQILYLSVVIYSEHWNLILLSWRLIWSEITFKNEKILFRSHIVISFWRLFEAQTNFMLKFKFLLKLKSFIILKKERKIKYHFENYSQIWKSFKAIKMWIFGNWNQNFFIITEVQECQLYYWHIVYS
jgi:hypothetical protein